MSAKKQVRQESAEDHRKNLQKSPSKISRFLHGIFENIFYLPSCGIFENVFVVLMGRMIWNTPRAARAYIHKIILDKWPCWHDTCQTAR